LKSVHPLFSSRNGLLFYLAAWIPLGGLLALSAGLTWVVAAPLTALLAFEAMSPWYLCKGLPLRSTPAWRLIIYHGAAVIMVSSLVLLAARILSSNLSRRPPNLPVLAGMVSLIYILSIALHYVVLTVQASREAELLARAAELKALKSQLNPHFLFNSLNSISALTSIDATRARDMCIRLADFLRTSLRLGECGAVLFQEEMELARMYLNVEQVRFGQRLGVVIEIDPRCAECEVPPLLVQPLVENAIKHGIATMAEGGEISMSAKWVDGGIRFQIENSFDPEAPAVRTNGMGLRNVRDRLRVRYGNDAGISIEPESGRYRVVLTIPCDRKGEKT
jgi:two-component system, LytTR family, sensor histidine kinase AlgZ